MICTSPEFTKQHINKLVCSVSPRTKGFLELPGLEWSILHCRNLLTTVTTYTPPSHVEMTGDRLYFGYKVASGCFWFVLEPTVFTDFTVVLYNRECKQLIFYLRSNPEGEGRFCPWLILLFLIKILKTRR